jgi:hypothetical protein
MRIKKFLVVSAQGRSVALTKDTIELEIHLPLWKNHRQSRTDDPILPPATFHADCSDWGKIMQRTSHFGHHTEETSRVAQS